MKNLTNIPEGDILNNCRKKYITLGEEKTLVEILAFDTKKFNPSHAEIQDKNITKFRNNDEKTDNEKADYSERSIRRAKKHIFDYMLCNNDLDGFVTLTLDKDKIDRYDYKAVMKKLNTWLDNMVRRKGFKYLLVPELHKDGAIHFHGFVKSSSLSLTDSNHRKADKVIYNIADYKYGFSTLIMVGGTYIDRVRVSGYIGKYITKQHDNNSPIGGRYYLHGGNLKEPEYEYTDMSFDEFDGDIFSPYPNATAKIWRAKI